MPKISKQKQGGDTMYYTNDNLQEPVLETEDLAMLETLEKY